MDGMQLPYVARCFRATVADRADDGDADVPGDEPEGGPSDGTDTDTLLIDFR
jgi:hypothetical protein